MGEEVMTREKMDVLYTDTSPQMECYPKWQVDKILNDFKIQLEEARAQGFREAVKEMDKYVAKG